MRSFIYYLLLIMLFACNKQDTFLDTKSNKADVKPSTLADFQAILDNDAVMNAAFPSMGIIGSDNFYVDYTAWQATSTAQERNTYTWNTEIYNGEKGFDWQGCYQSIGYANIVLEGLQNIAVTAQNQTDHNAVRGAALFFRAYALYDLAQLFAKPYRATTAATDLGLPLRLSSDVNKTSVRSSLAETYQQVIEDLNASLNLLPAVAPYKTRPSQAAAQALLARVYLMMGDYGHALSSATTALGVNATLLDYNTVNTAATIAFPAYQTSIAEIIFYSSSNSFGLLSYANMKVDTLLYRSYATNDLRRTVFYKDNGATGIAYKGDYTGNVIPAKFSGMATNELWLIRAEANARLGNTSAALTDLNTLLAKRWKTGTFVSVTATSADDAVTKILTERRKELPFTGDLRWEDLRRLNQEPAYAKTVKRILNGQTYTLDPNDQRYVLPIPDIEIKLSGIEQNPR